MTIIEKKETLRFVCTDCDVLFEPPENEEASCPECEESEALGEYTGTFADHLRLNSVIRMPEFTGYEFESSLGIYCQTTEAFHYYFRLESREINFRNELSVHEVPSDDYWLYEEVSPEFDMEALYAYFKSIEDTAEDGTEHYKQFLIDNEEEL